MKWYALDVETATKALGSLCEIAVAEFYNDKHTGKHFQSMIYPPGNIYDSEIQTQYTSSDTADAPQWAEVSKKISRVVGASPVVAHNMHFDMRHLWERKRKEGTWCPEYEKSFCSLRLARWADPIGPSNHKLVSLITHLGIPFHGDAHTALADAIGAGDVFVHYANTFGGVEAAMRKLAGDQTSGTWRWLREHRESVSPDAATHKQQNFIAKMLNSMMPISTATWQDITDLVRTNTSDDDWLYRLTKLQASDLISYIKPLAYPASDKVIRAAQALIDQTIKNDQQIECDIEHTSSGFWLMQYAGCAQMVLRKRPEPGEEHAVFLSSASEDDMMAVVNELASRLGR